MKTGKPDLVNTAALKNIGEMPNELAAAGGALSVDNPMVGVDEEQEGGAVSQADMDAALEEYAAAANMPGTDEKFTLVYNLLGMLMAVSAATVPAEDLGTTIKQAATAVFAHFRESPTNWCAWKKGTPPAWLLA